MCATVHKNTLQGTILLQVSNKYTIYNKIFLAYIEVVLESSMPAVGVIGIDDCNGSIPSDSAVCNVLMYSLPLPLFL